MCGHRRTAVCDERIYIPQYRGTCLVFLAPKRQTNLKMSARSGPILQTAALAIGRSVLKSFLHHTMVALTIATRLKASAIITSDQSKLTTGRIAGIHGRFSGIRQMAPACTPPNTCFLGPTRVHNPNDTSIGWGVFLAGLTTYLLTDRQTTQTIGRIYVRTCSTAMRPNYNK